MSKNFINIDRLTPLLLPQDLREWIHTDHMVHFIIEAINKVDLSTAKVNLRGTGSKQYPPHMMFALLIYSYITGTFSSRRIEAMTYDNVAVRYLCADHHPDHDSICTFRRVNEILFKSVFHQILELAARTKIIKFGNLTVSIDGTKIFANASKHNANSYDHVVEHIQLAHKEIEELVAKAEKADSTPLQDGLTIPKEIAHREERIARLTEAKAEMEARAKERFATETADYENKLAKRKAKEEATGRKPRDCAPKAPENSGPNAKDQYNSTLSKFLK